MSSERPIISLTSDEEEEEVDDIEEVEFRNATQQLIDNPAQADDHNTTKRLADIQCPICFDDVSKATVTSCGHVFCLECIDQSISSSHARGQVRNTQRGKGLCPLCRKEVTFKETILIRAKKAQKTGEPELPAQ
ncbi:E3 ubiquitin-protein ligase complex SLX5-SLX8 subunit SLX8 [Candida viswanathii]|uniref:E3 ubiquitin-protein ligase complex SLX5-SLX8 subunit SLX8 n=1 Tax=Candida viswanathii TaxID=5486 RepID=A0A367XNZ9_9ASCO|nr:E3 ubiquitin-protein ligase complex SLX5-SLX8 subunit SLX8 [Candida viswanathii]